MCREHDLELQIQKAAIVSTYNMTFLLLAHFLCFDLLADVSHLKRLDIVDSS